MEKRRKIRRQPCLASYLGFPKKKEEGWIFVEKTRAFKSLLEAMEISQEFMKKNKKIVKVLLEEKTLIDMKSEIAYAIILYNWEYKKKAKKKSQK